MNQIDLEALHLEKGAHKPDSRFCVMEAVAYIAGEPWTDRPQCASPVITTFLQSWNDALDDKDRQMLKPLIPLVIGTRTGKADEQRRAWLATDWLVRTYTPAWLTLISEHFPALKPHADALAGLKELTSSTRAKRAMPIMVAARVAARAAAGDAAGDAAWAAAWAAAGDAAWAAAWAAAGDAGRDAAWAAAWDAGRDAAWAAAWAAAGDAAWAAAWAAAGDALRPTIELLQASALDLIRRMCLVGVAA